MPYGELMPTANLTMHADPAVLVRDAKLTGLLAERFDVVWPDPVDPTTITTETDHEITLTVEPDGSVDVFFMEDTNGSVYIRHGELQARLRELNIAYSWRSEVYVGNDGFEYEDHFWMPGWDEEMIRMSSESGQPQLPEGFWEAHQHLTDAELGAKVREHFAFTFQPPVLCAT